MNSVSEKFYLFGMGNRKKYVYKNGELISVSSMQVEYRWNVVEEEIVPEMYTVNLKTDKGAVTIEETENGVFICKDGNRICIAEGVINLPDFSEYKYSKALRILHHEICINIVDGKPVPNLFVYANPWYRDAAMMVLSLEKTDNTHLIKEWAKNLTDYYDRNNAGNEESDNLGQVLYVLAKTGNENHPLISKIIEEAKRISVDGALTGTSDFAPHPVYQTKWMKMGLEALGQDSSWLKIPDVDETYSALFWMDGHEEEGDSEPYDEDYPYLSWARLHAKRAKLTGIYLDSAEEPSYPISSETNASQADYENQRKLFPELAKKRCGAPHSWHAAEMFLYLIEFKN